MLPLKTNTFPGNAADLERLLNDSVRDLFHLPNDPVTVREVSYPRLVALTVSLDGAKLSGQPAAIPSPVGESIPALTVDSFNVKGSGISIGPAAVDFALEAQHIQLRRAADSDGNIILLLHKARDGKIQVSVATTDLEALIADVARAEAGKHGVNVDSVQLSLRSRSPRSLAAEVRLRAKKLFVSASLRITGQLDLDEQLNAKISGLDCTGDGAIASVACGILKPHLQKLEGREFPLMSLPLGEVRLRDVRIVAGDKLSVTAEFGGA